MEKTFLKTALTALMVCLSISSAQAIETEFLPKSRTQKFETFAFYTENHTSMLLRDHSKAWASLASNFVPFEFQGTEIKTQMVIFGSAHAAFRVKGMLNTETVDARAGMRFNSECPSGFLFTVGWMHQSGHVSDNIIDTDLFGSNLGYEIFILRAVYPIHDWRLGASFTPYVGMDPTRKTLAFDQFAEYFPMGVSRGHKKPTPFIAAGIEENGIDRMKVTSHVQTGVYFGNHVGDDWQPTVRLALGYYNGNDPRLKYAQFKKGRDQFGYFGLLLNL